MNMNLFDGVYVYCETRGPGLLGGIARNIDDGAIFVKGSAVASSGSAGNVLYFFRRQLAGASASQYPVRHDLFQHVLLLFIENDFL
jgi:hypothetical protein